MRRRTKRLLSAVGHDVAYGLLILGLLVSLKAFWSVKLLNEVRPPESADAGP